MSITEKGDSSKMLHLIDDSLLEDLHDGAGAEAEPAMAAPPVDNRRKLPLPVSDKSDDDCSLLARSEDDSCGAGGEAERCVLQGCLRRKTVAKAGRKPAVTSWQRYWVQLWPSNIVYYSPKTFKGNSRCDFKREPHKVFSVAGCSVELGAMGTLQPDVFQLVDAARGNIYKFRAGTRAQAERWTRVLQDLACATDHKPLPVNLMSFE